MILPIEKWIAEQNFPVEATNLLDEGIICYKSGAYRAGLLFSYLGFEKIIKNRLLDARRPDNIHEGAWGNIQRDVNNDSKWEETVFDTITGFSNMPIFLQDNKKREEMNRHLSYWRDRRNDAAHAKENEINNAHVEVFWTFMQSNIPKLVVRGSRAAILDNIKLHFDSRYTPEGSDFSHIIQQIKHSLYEEDLKSFYKDVKEVFEDLHPFYPFISDSEMNSFWNEIFKLGEPFSTSLVQYFKSEDGADVFIIVIQDFPRHIALFHEEKQFIHNLWYEKIKDFEDPYKIMSALLRNSLIEERNQEEALKKLILNLNNKIPSDGLDFMLLNQYGYLNHFRKLVFGIDSETKTLINDFSWGNKNLNPVRHYLEHNGLDDEVVNSLCRVFMAQPYPDKMCANLKDYFNNHKDIKEEFIRISEGLRATPPTSLGFNS
ncbi:hypothetical protein [Halobacillus aidingensis]|uniref:Uncharacterized protein n=1 Tax=Halobacillus aidingensis TaxID=240303 RepID=A0A1H0G1C2_HALAD|nr:hypothetical protein [Halobacillus aidingensis]SDO00662.1 hypothetical protein SAMN05421677_102188 [Halobacillus aidingensis]